MVEIKNVAFWANENAQISWAKTLLQQFSEMSDLRTQGFRFHDFLSNPTAKDALWIRQNCHLVLGWLEVILMNDQSDEEEKLNSSYDALCSSLERICAGPSDCTPQAIVVLRSHSIGQKEALDEMEDAQMIFHFHQDSQQEIQRLKHLVLEKCPLVLNSQWQRYQQLLDAPPKTLTLMIAGKPTQVPHLSVDDIPDECWD